MDIKKELKKFGRDWFNDMVNHETSDAQKCMDIIEGDRILQAKIFKIINKTLLFNAICELKGSILI